jgi:hypothetical protein
MNENRFTVNGSVSLRGPNALLTAIPYLLGFAPDRCLVVVAMATGQLEVTARLDLPTPADAPAAAASLTRALSHTNTTDVMVVGYGDADSVIPVLTPFAAHLNWPVRETLRVEANRWWNLTCDDPTCCPPGAPISPSSEVTAAMIATSGAPAASRRDRAAALQPGPDHLLDEVRAALNAVGSLEAADLYATLGQARTVRQERRAVLDAGDAAVLLHAVRDLAVRDACCGWHDVGALNLWLDLLPTAPTGWAAPVATLLAVTAYQRGDGALAVLALDRATGDDPAYTLARLVDQLMAAGIPPADLTAVLDQALQANPLAAAQPSAD